MRNFVIAEDRPLHPFNEPARNLTVVSTDGMPISLTLHQNEVTARCLGPCPAEEDLTDISDLLLALQRPRSGVDPKDEVFVYRDNIYFDKEFLDYFLKVARKLNRPCQAVLPADDPAWAKYTFPLSSLRRVYPSSGPSYYPIDMWFFPSGWANPDEWVPLAIPSDAVEKGYYNIPDSMANIKLDPETNTQRREQDLTHWLSERTCVVIESWVHLFNATVPLGAFSFGSRFEEYVARHNFFALRLLFRAVLEQKQMLSSSKVVKVGAGTDIHPSAVILGPATIGKNCAIGPGVVIDNCVIGDNVNIAQGCQLMLSVVGPNVFLPFRAALFMTLLMENTIVAQNTCLQMCVVGRNSFVGAGTTFTDFNLLPSPIKALNYKGELEDIRQPVIGGCVGHNCRLGAGLVIYPARTIESDTILIASPERRVVMKNITYEQSDHHRLNPEVARRHKRLYRRSEVVDESQLLEEWT
jgi:carbonic anhydrase/acetyltransferase-like protein (isoleucine patch superfamily)